MSKIPTRERILDSALMLFSEKGYDGVGVDLIAENAGIPCQLSLEQRMGCGIGACLVCTCETIFEGTDRQKRVCKDGPVFESTEVTLNA